MAEIQNIYVLTNKIENKDFYCIHEKADYYLLIFFHSSILFSYDGKNYFPVNKNSIVLYSPQQIQAYKSNDEFFLNSFLIFNTEKEYFDDFNIPFNTPFTLTEQQINELILILDGISFIKNTAFFPEKRPHIPQIIGNLFRQIEQYYNSSQSNDNLTKLLHFAQKNIIDDPINNTVRSLAKKSGYSESYFCKIYRQQFGVSPGQERQQQIIKQIKIYLETTNHSLETIAELCGISSLPFMIKIFKKNEKLTPHQYRLKMQKEKTTNKKTTTQKAGEKK